MTHATSPDTLQERATALGTLVRGIAGEYRVLVDAADEYAAYLQRQLKDIERLAEALDDLPCPSEIGLDDEIPF